MRKGIFFLLAALFILVINSCGVNYAYVFNHNQNATEVHLSEKNFEVVDRVSGSAEVSYIFLIGGSKKRQLYADAYANMVRSANLTGSKALVNVFTEEHGGGVPPFFIRRTVTVSAHVVEFQ